LQKHWGLGWILVVYFLGSCQDRTPVPPRSAANSEYFDLTGFIQEQAQLLNTEKAAAVKSVQEAGETAETKVVKNLNWTKELESFAEVDLNKPAFRNAYTVSRETQPSGLVTETYRRKPETESAIQFMAVTKSPQNQVMAIRAMQESSNLLISTRKEMELTCHTKNGVNRVQSFRIKGEQKPLLFDALHYTIFTQIR
jgi:hypothetical protein